MNDPHYCRLALFEEIPSTAMPRMLRHPDGRLAVGVTVQGTACWHEIWPGGISCNSRASIPDEGWRELVVTDPDAQP